MHFYAPQYRPAGDEVAIVQTTKGDITVRLDGMRLPNHVGCFVELARKGFYDELKFFRLEENRIIKGGCPTTRLLPSEAVRHLSKSPSSGIGRGSAGFWIDHEALAKDVNRHERGALVMSHGVGFNFASCQFHFCLGPAPEMNGREPVIGHVVAGEEVMESLCVGDVILGIAILNSNDSSIQAS